MIKQLKTNIALVYAISILLVLVIGFDIFLGPNDFGFNFFEWYSEFSLIIQNNLVLNYTISTSLVLITGYFIVRSFNKTSFFNKTTAFPLFIFILIMSTLKSFEFDTNLVINLIFTLIFLRLIDLDQNKTAVHVSFVSGILCGIAFLFSYWLLPIGLVVFYGLISFRPFQWREWLVGLLGMCLPELYFYSIRYITEANSSTLVQNPNLTEVKYNLFDFLSFVIFGIIAVISLLSLLKQLNSLSNIERKLINVLTFFTAVSIGISASIFWYYRIEYFVFTAPLTLLVSVPLLNMKISRFLSLLIVALVVLNLLRIFLFS